LRISVVIAALALVFSSASGLARASEPDDAVEASDTELEEGLADRAVMPRMGMDFTYPEEGTLGQIGAGVGFGQVGEDLFLTLNLSMVIAGDDWAIAPRVPLRLCVVDNAPETADVVRTEDWDEIGDFARLVAFAEYGRHGDSFYVRFGEFVGSSVGHGTLVNQYYNTVDIDHYQAGIIGALDMGIAGGEVMLDNVFDPEVVVARPYVRPFRWLDSWPAMFRNLKIGVTVGGDFQAPLELVMPPSPAVTGLGVGAQVGGAFGFGTVLGAANGAKSPTAAVVHDGQHRAGEARSLAIPLLGFDLEIPFLNLEHVAVVPYLDVNTIDTQGIGVHFGTFVTVQFGTFIDWRTRLEYRLSGAGYEPTYVDAFYEVHRLVYRDGLPKLGWLRTGPKRSRTGFSIESEFRLLGTMRLLMSIAHDEGGKGAPPSNDLVMRLLFPEIGPVAVSAYFARLDFHTADELFDLENSVFVINARYNVMDYFYVRARVVNEWWLRHEPSGQSSYETTTDFDLGVGLMFDL
jgi:hypothetical protein